MDAWVVRKGRTLTVLVTNHALPHHSVNPERVQIVLRNAPGRCRAYVERIDESHANPRAMWREMGEPDYPSAPEVECLREASLMRKEPHACVRANEKPYLDSALPPHAVAAITVEFAPENTDGGEAA